MNDSLTTKEAAKKTGYTVRMIQHLIKEGVITAQKIGRDWLIKSEDLKNINRKRKAK